MLVSLIVIATQLVLVEGTELLVRLERAVSSKTARSGDAVALSVVGAVRIGECTVIRQDAAVEGRVLVAKEKSRLGRDGRLDIAAERVQAADGSWLRVRHQPVKPPDAAITGASAAAKSFGLIWYAPVAPVAVLFSKGDDVWIPKATRFKIYTDEVGAFTSSCGPVP